MADGTKPKKPRKKKTPTPPPKPPPDANPIHPNGRADRAAELQTDLRLRDHPMLLTADRVAPQAVEWLIPDILPAGRLVLVSGPRDSGKSTFFAACVGAVTSANGMGTGRLDAPGRVVLYSPEEDIETEVMGRLESHLTHLLRVHLGDRGADNRPAKVPHLPDRFGELASIVESTRARLLILDPISRQLSPGINIRDEQHVASVLMPLVDLARKTGCTICYTCHLRKDRSGDSMDWVLGSGAWTGIPRFVLLLGKDPHDDTKRVLSWSRCAVSQKPASRYFTITGQQGRGVFSIGLKNAIVADDLTGQSAERWERDAMAEAMEFLRQSLSEERRMVNDLFQQARDGGISISTLRKAKIRLNVGKAYELTGGQCRWYWTAPEKWPE